MPAADVTIVTYEKYPDLPPDDRIFRDALERRGAAVRTAVWSDGAVDWSATPRTVLRATWDYPRRFAEFAVWLRIVEEQTLLFNDAPTVRWNAHKRYLADLERRGIAIAPTLFLERGTRVDVARLCADRTWRDVVIKPCIGGSSYGALRFSNAAIATQGARHAQTLLQAGDAMLQPYLPEIDHAGEAAFIFIEGSFSHAVRKTPFNSATETTTEQPHGPAPREMAFASKAVAALDRVPAYARVDVVPTASGPLLMELELVEPTLYFEFEPRAAEWLAEAILTKREARP